MTEHSTAREVGVETKDKTLFTFSSLGFWRKLFLIINILSTVVMIGFLLMAIFSAGFEKLFASVFLLAVCVLLIGYCYWVYLAVIGRKVSQLTILTIIQIIPFLNPLGALVFLAIRSTSKKEATLEIPAGMENEIVIANKQ